MDQMTRLVAYEEIRQLAHRYAVYLDARDIDALVGLYVPDVRISSRLSGRDALAGLLDGALRAVGVTFLNVGNHVIDLEGDVEGGDPHRARGIAYCRAEIQDGGIDSDRWIHHAIQYHDTYEFRDGRWYFGANRKHLLVYGAEHGVNPLTLPPAEWPKSQTGMGSVPHDLATWRAFWGLDAG